MLQASQDKFFKAPEDMIISSCAQGCVLRFGKPSINMATPAEGMPSARDVDVGTTIIGVMTGVAPSTGNVSGSGSGPGPGPGAVCLSASARQCSDD